MKQKATNVAKSELRKGAFSGNLDVEEKVMQRGNYQAYTKLKSKDIYVAYDPRVLEKEDESTVLSVIKDTTAHEINHHKYKGCVGCPQNVDKDHDLFFLPMYEILEEKGFQKADVNYATNALQDTILHKDLKKNAKKGLEGITLFFKDQGQNAKDKKLTEFYEAHVKFNLDLWGTKDQRKTISMFYKNTPKVKEVLDGFYSELNEGNFKTKINSYTRSGEDKKRKDFEIEAFDKQSMGSYFLNENKWEEISKIYAKHFSKLMTPGYAMPTPDHSGGGTKGNKEKESPEDGNPFKKERESKVFKKGRVMESNKKGEGAPGWIEPMQALDILYEGLAQQIQIKAESFTNPETLPISWYGEREFNPERDNHSHLKFGIGEDGKPEIRKKRWSVDVPINVKTSPQSFPKIKFGMVDVSASMTDNLNDGDDVGNTSIIPWGDNSKYHWALMTQFGIFEYFKKNHLLTQNSISAATFGSNTLVVEGYQNVKDHLLTPNFESTTRLELDNVKKFFQGKGNLVYTIGDGEIWNWDNIKDEFIGLAKNHSYVHLHMGTDNGMTDDLRNAGLEVIVAEDGKGIVNKVVDLTDKVMRR